MLCFACYAEGLLRLCHYGTAHTLDRTEKSPKSNHSRTSESFSRKSNHSRTYENRGGVGVSKSNVASSNSFVFFGHVNYSVKYNCRRADICEYGK